MLTAVILLTILINLVITGYAVSKYIKVKIDIERLLEHKKDMIQSHKSLIEEVTSLKYARSPQQEAIESLESVDSKEVIKKLNEQGVFDTVMSPAFNLEDMYE